MMEERIISLERRIRELEAKIAIWLAVHSEPAPVAMGIKEDEHAETKD